jgi:hypothetical protein
VAEQTAIQPQSQQPSPSALTSALWGGLKSGNAEALHRLLQTAAQGVAWAPGEEWVAFVLAATRLPLQLKATMAGEQFRAVLVQDLPARLELLQPADLVRLVKGWPRCGLDEWGRRVIQAVVEACIQRLDAFGPSDLAQLVKGLCRPVTVRSLTLTTAPLVRRVINLVVQPPPLHSHTHTLSHTRTPPLSPPNPGDAAGGAQGFG